MAEIIAENFQPETIARMSGYKYVPMVQPGQMLAFDEQTIQLLRDDRMRSYRVEVETDSTIQADENAEKERRTEFVQAVGLYLNQAATTVKEAPALARVVGEILMFAVRAFRAGRNLEDVIEQGFQMLVQQSMQAAQQPQEDPLVGVAREEVRGKIEKARIDARLKDQKQKADAELKVREQNIDAALELRKQNIEVDKNAMQHAANQVDSLDALSLRRETGKNAPGGGGIGGAPTGGPF